MSESVLSSESDIQLICRAGPNKPKVESLSVFQWSTANLAILQRLVDEGTLPQGQLLEYLSHTSRVYRPASSYDWASVLLFDREYRRLQHLNGFRWGTAVSHLSEEYIRLKAPGSFAQNNQRKKGASLPWSGKAGAQFASHTGQGREICKRYNSKGGCSMRLCRHEHVCGIPGCTEKHSAIGQISKTTKRETHSWFDL